MDQIVGGYGRCWGAQLDIGKLGLEKALHGGQKFWRPVIVHAIGKHGPND